MLILMAAGLLLAIQCRGQLPKGAETNGATFHPKYVNPTPGQIPIAVWGAVTDKTLNEEWFRNIRGCGANLAISALTDSAAIVRSLELAQKADVGVILFSWAIHNTIKAPALIRAIRGYKSLAGYYLADEPTADKFSSLLAVRNMVYTMDTTHLAYVNLFPIVAPRRIQAASYTDYVTKSVRELDRPIISYDNYPICETDGRITVRSNFYQNLEEVSQVSRSTGRPFWAYGMIKSHLVYPEPTVEHLRYETFNALAYGAQGIQYYRYMVYDSENPDSTIAPAMENGRLTVVWDRLRTINAEIQSYADVFLGATVVNTGHLGTIPEGCTRLTRLPAPFTRIRTGREGVLVSQMVNNGTNYLVITNHSLEETQNIRVDWNGTDRSHRVQRVYGDGVTQPIRPGRITLPPAGYIILTY